MTHAILIFLLSFRLLVSFGSVFFSYKIARLKTTPSSIWYLFTAAFILRLILSGIILFSIPEFINIHSVNNEWVLIKDQFVEALISGLFLIGVTSIYYKVLNKQIWKY